MNPVIVGEGFKNIPHIISVIAKVLIADTVADTTAQRIRSVLSTLNSTIPPHVIQSKEFKKLLLTLVSCLEFTKQ